MIDYEKLDREFLNQSNVEPNVSDDIDKLLPMFGDHISMREEKLKACTTEFQKVFKKAPLTVLKKLFLSCAWDHLIVSGVLRVLRSTKKAIDYRLGEHSVYVPLFRWLLNNQEVDIYLESVYKGLSNLMTNITKCYDDGVQKVEMEVAHATDIVGEVVIQLLFNDDEYKRFMGLDVLHRIFSTGLTAKKTRIAWSSEENENSVNPGLLAYFFLSIFQTDLVKHNLKFRNQLIETIESMGNRLRVDKYIIPDKYSNLLRKEMNKCEWVVTFSFVKWFKGCLSCSLRPEIPVSVHRVLSQESKDRYFVLNRSCVSLNDNVLDFLVAFFDLALFQEDGVLHFFNQEKEFCVGFYSEHVGLRMSKAVVVAADKFLAGYPTIEGLYRLAKPLEWLIDHLQPMRDYRVLYDDVMNEVIFRAIHEIEPVLIVLDAACDALLDPYAMKSDKTKELLFDFAFEYMKIHINKTFAEVEEMSLEILPPPAFHEWEAVKSKYWTQCHVLSTYFQENVKLKHKFEIFGRCFMKISNYFNSTMPSLNRTIEKTERARKHAWEEREESRKHRTFYAYAQPHKKY